jgi:hypothetical protein
VSRRKRRAEEVDPGRRPAPAANRPASPSGWGLAAQIGFAVAVFAVVTLVAELAGAANLGVALGIGQIAFAIAVVYLLVRR